MNNKCSPLLVTEINVTRLTLQPDEYSFPCPYSSLTPGKREQNLGGIIHKRTLA